MLDNSNSNVVACPLSVTFERGFEIIVQLIIFYNTSKRLRSNYTACLTDTRRIYAFAS